MNPQTHGNSSSSPADPPLRRRRGRPRKDEGFIQGEDTPPVPGSDSVKKSKQSMVTTGTVGGDMLGQVVYGVIDGSFDAGYLVKVKVADSDTHLRGVIFLPGRFTPITAANDVAPQVKMYKRADIPIPAPNSIMAVPGSVPPSEQCGKQPAEHNNLPPSVQVQGPQAELTNVPVTQENLPDSMLPLTANLPPSSGGPSLGLKVMPVEYLDLGLKSQSALIMGHMEHGKVAEQGEGPQKFESSLGKDPEANTKVTEQQCVPSADVLFKPDQQTQTASHDQEPNPLVHEEKQATVIAEPATVASEPVALNNLLGEDASPVKASLQELGLKANNGVDASHLDGSQAINAADAAEKDSQSAPMSGLSVTTFESKTIPSEPNLTIEGSPIQQSIGPQFSTSGATNSVKADLDTAAMTGLPGTLLEREAIPSETKHAGPILPLMTETHYCGSADAANNIDCNIKDHIPPTES
uniref:AT hook motif-containing protein n=1 Tax=Rhizophora mucronata TaxID=61149 RepID=A0A2P2J343_RHIMU